MISVYFQTESHYPVKKKNIEAAVIAHLERKVKRATEVGVYIIGNRRMRTLNREYRQKDYPTDVLSFPLNDPSYKPSAPFIDPPDDVLRLGDIVVSYPKAVEEAAEENKFVEAKIIELVLHGLDHLLGIHHPE